MSAQPGPGAAGAGEPTVEELGDHLDLAHAETGQPTWGDVGARSHQLLRSSIGLGCDVALLSARTAGRLITRPLRR